MNIGLNAAQARAKSSQDMVVFNECTAIMKAIITTSATGVYETYVADATTMTECTPGTIKIGTVNAPTVTVGQTLIINSNAGLGFTDGIYVPPTPTSTTYFSSWQGAVTDRALDNQMNTVIKYFGNLGYKLNRLTNSATGKTFRWHVYW